MGLRYGGVPANPAKLSFKRPNRPFTEWWRMPHGTSQILPYTMTSKFRLYETSFLKDMLNITGKWSHIQTQNFNHS